MICKLKKSLLFSSYIGDEKVGLNPFKGVNTIEGVGALVVRVVSGSKAIFFVSNIDSYAGGVSSMTYGLYWWLLMIIDGDILYSSKWRSKERRGGLFSDEKLVFTCWWIEYSSFFRSFLESIATISQSTKQNNEDEWKNNDQNPRKEFFLLRTINDFSYRMTLGLSPKSGYLSGGFPLCLTGSSVDDRFRSVDHPYCTRPFPNVMLANDSIVVFRCWISLEYIYINNHKMYLFRMMRSQEKWIDRKNNTTKNVNLSLSIWLPNIHIFFVLFFLLDQTTFECLEQDRFYMVFISKFYKYCHT